MRTLLRRTLLSAAFLAVGGLVLFLASGGHAGVTNSPHDFTTTNSIYSAAPLARSGACSMCHIPHRALDNAIWIRSLSNYRTSLTLDGSAGKLNYLGGLTLLCYDCHESHNVTASGYSSSGGIDDVPAFSTFISNHKPQDIAFGYTNLARDPATTLNTGSRMREDAPANATLSGISGYYENSPPYASNYGANPNLSSRTQDNALLLTGGHYFKSGNPSATVLKGDKIPCSDCHNPHKWESSTTPGGGWQAFFSPGPLVDTTRWTSVFSSFGTAGKPVGSTYMTNDLRAGVDSARSNLESRKMCIVCHGDGNTTAAITMNQFNPSYSSLPIVRTPATVPQHNFGSTAACTECHLHNSIGASCTSCHGFPPSIGATKVYPTIFTPTQTAPFVVDSHPRHYGGASGQVRNALPGYYYTFDCKVCHYGSAMGTDPLLGQHQNNLVSVVIQRAWTSLGGNGYDNTNYYNWAYANPTRTGQLDNGTSATGWAVSGRAGNDACRNVYCHSAGRRIAYMTANDNNDYPVPRWNSGPVHCNDCHGLGTVSTNANYGMPSYANTGAGTAKANSHAIHVVTNGIECYVCHRLTVDNTVTGANRAIRSDIVGVSNPTHHVDNVQDVVFDQVNALNGPRALAWQSSDRTCSVSCHGTDTPAWGGTLVNGCFSCHTGTATEQIYKPQLDYGTPGSANPVNLAQYTSAGHGRLTIYPGDNNPGAAFDNYTIRPSECYVCHAENAPHLKKSANDPYRLGHATDGTTAGMGNYTGQFADNTDRLCLGCHGSAADRAGHDNAAKGSRTIDMQIHARSMMSNPERNWPGPSYPWKCVDCHDPHGDANWKMVRSGINAPINASDTLMGSNVKSTPRRTDASVLAVNFTSVAGHAANSYTQPSNPGGPYGPCEVCHTQTPLFTRTLDNTDSHTQRINRCTTCHPHNAGFAPKACKGCHGPDGTTPNAPDVGRYWAIAGGGHGQFQARPPLVPVARPIECEDCHDTMLYTAADHKTNVAGFAPGNINTYVWGGKAALNADTTTNRNTAHLKAGFIAAAPATRADVARTFDQYCLNTATGCHTSRYHQHTNGAATKVMTFGNHGTTTNPKGYLWYPWNTAVAANYRNNFYMPISPWIDNDISVYSGAAADRTTNYGVCVSCHDPHGTGVTATSGYTGLGYTNHMLRGDWGPTDPTKVGQWCNTACHNQ